MKLLSSIFKNYSGLFIVLLLSSAVGAQSSSVTKESFENQYYELLEKARGIPRIVTSKLQRFDNAALKSTETWAYKYLPPDRRQVVYDIVEGNSKRHIGELDVDGGLYCENDAGVWTRSKSLCFPGLLRSKMQSTFQVLGKISSEYSEVEANLKNARVRILREYTKYQNRHQDTKGSEKIWFYENRYWVDEKGLIVARN